MGTRIRTDMGVAVAMTRVVREKLFFFAGHLVFMECLPRVFMECLPRVFMECLPRVFMECLPRLHGYYPSKKSMSYEQGE